MLSLVICIAAPLFWWFQPRICVCVRMCMRACVCACVCLSDCVHVFVIPCLCHAAISSTLFIALRMWMCVCLCICRAFLEHARMLVAGIFAARHNEFATSVPGWHSDIFRGKLVFHVSCFLSFCLHSFLILTLFYFFPSHFFSFYYFHFRFNWVE